MPFQYFWTKISGKNAAWPSEKIGEFFARNSWNFQGKSWIYRNFQIFPPPPKTGLTHPQRLTDITGIGFSDSFLFFFVLVLCLCVLACLCFVLCLLLCCIAVFVCAFLVPCSSNFTKIDCFVVGDQARQFSCKTVQKGHILFPDLINERRKWILESKLL